MKTNAEQKNLVTADYAHHISKVFGERGIDWLNSLASIIESYEKKWKIKAQPAFAHLSHNYVAPATDDTDRNLVLKIGVPAYEFLSEIDALSIFNGDGVNKIYESNPEHGVMLIERLKPGKMLSELENDDNATEVAGLVMKNLWKRIDEHSKFPTMTKWFQGLKRYRENYDTGRGPLPDELVSKAERLSQELLSTSHNHMLLHGDLHHKNILSATREPWLAIDPKGLIGEPEYEIGALLRNPIPELYSMPNLKNVLMRRIDILHEILGFDKDRMKGWAFSQAVLSAFWILEDSGKGWEPMMGVAGVLGEML